MITHDPEDVRAFGDHVLRMENGSMLRVEESAA
jgi:molybdate transport system ATP-binding protein